MRAIIFLTGALLFTTAFPAFADHQQVTIHVNGMVCDFCAQGIKKQFKATNAVTDVAVDLEKKIVTLKLDHKGNLTDDAIKAKLKDAGYEVVDIKRI